MIIRVCDRCNKKITQDVTKYVSVLQLCRRLHANYADTERVMSFELCEDCIGHIMRWIEDENN